LLGKVLEPHYAAFFMRLPAVALLPRAFSTLPARKVAKELSGHESCLKI
jgi:hypothetical protein